MTAPADIPALRAAHAAALAHPWASGRTPTTEVLAWIATSGAEFPALLDEVARLRLLVTDTVEQIDSMGYAECADCHADHAAGEGHREDCIWTPLVAEAKRINGEKI